MALILTWPRLRYCHSCFADGEGAEGAGAVGTGGEATEEILDMGTNSPAVIHGTWVYSAGLQGICFWDVFVVVSFQR
eukprot:scaffold285195_cov22-Tisochrysis_lutea.AAC.1